MSNVAVNNFKHSYVYEMICLLAPRFRDWDIINSLFSEVDFNIGSREYPIGFPVNKRNVRQLQTNHQQLVNAACWNEIRCLDLTHAETICSNNARLERDDDDLPVSGRTRPSNSASNHSNLNRINQSTTDAGSTIINGDVEHAVTSSGANVSNLHKKNEDEAEHGKSCSC